jgi:phage terminase small subunit
MSKLSPLQSRFVDEYLRDLNAAQAAIRAGYSAKGANSKGAQLLAIVSIGDAVQERMKARSQRTQVDSDYVIAGIVKNIERAEQSAKVVNAQGQPVFVETPDGDLAPSYKYDPTNALRGYELLGRHLKMFTDKIDHSNGDGSLAYKHMSDEQLDERVAELLAQAGNSK